MSELHGITDKNDYQELRLALVMNGGVSLAVWMGGVTHEINRLVQKAGAYGQVMTLTASIARVDVISGTSAGGINGALLALAVVYDAGLDSIRSLWMERGALDVLMRRPWQLEAPSLLDGEMFFVSLRQAFAAIKNGTVSNRTAPSEVPIELTLTTTLLNGEPNQLIDDLGTGILDVKHRGRFEFKRGPDLGSDDFGDHIEERLAQAARATASFPVAFEPPFCPVGQPAADERLHDMKDFVNFGHSRFLLDGGILDNKPFESAVEAVLRQRADREVRRVLAYVVPNPGQTAASVPDKVETPPAIGQVALASLVSLQGVESISDQLRDIVDHNQKVRRKKEHRLWLTLHLDPARIQELARTLYPLYRLRRVHSALDYIATEVALGVLAKSPRTPFGRRRREWLIEALSKVEQFPWIPSSATLDGALARSAEDNWGWGALTVQRFIAGTLELLRLAMGITHPQQEDSRAIRSLLRELRRLAYDFASLAPLLRRGDQEFWRKKGEEIAPRRGAEDLAPDLQEISRSWLEEWADRTMSRDEVLKRAPKAEPFLPALPELRTREVMSIVVRGIALVVSAAATPVRLAAALASRSARQSERETAERLERYVTFLCPEPNPEAPLSQIPTVIARMLTFEVVQHAFASDSEVHEQYVELVQVSANVPTAFGGPDNVADKLAGAQLANFAGFYKKVWRANDWMFGRLDGSERLARIIMNPSRLMRLYGAGVGLRRGSQAVIEELHYICVGSSSEAASCQFLDDYWQKSRQRIAAELAFLDDPNAFVPEVLPHCSSALARRLHLEIVQEEMPNVIALADQECAIDSRPETQCRNLLAAVARERQVAKSEHLPPAALVKLLLDMGIGRERVMGEIGTDRFTRTASRVVSVTIAALAGERSGLGGFRRAFQVLRVPALVFDGLVHMLAGMSRTGAALFAAALSVSITLLALEQFGGAELADWLSNAAIVVLVAALLAILLGSWQRKWLRWTIVAAVAAVAAWLVVK